MSEHYSELIDDDTAKLVLGDVYKPGLLYTLTTERDRFCVSAYDKETGEHVDLVVGNDGIGDDYKLEEEEAELCKEEIERINEEKDNDYSAHAFGVWKYLIPISIVIFNVALALAAHILLR